MGRLNDDLYYFDEKAADRAVKWIEKFLTHYEDRWAGLAFILLAWQRQVVRDLFGWKRTADGLRRYRECYIEIAKGNGKSPLLAAIGCYMMLADGEEGAHVISAATDHKQANVTFDAAKKMMEANDRLARMTKRHQYDIQGPHNSKWEVVSGTAAGKAGQRPTCLLMDEAWEWPNRRLYDSMSRNARKRSQPLIVVATNAGASRDSICWELHERARRVSTGESRDDTLYPCLYAAGDKDDAGDPATWAKANPALDAIITTDTLKAEWTKATEVPALEAEFRRLHLSQWVQGTDKWLDMAQWDKATGPVRRSTVEKLPLVVGLDMSLVDDLTAIGLVWRDPEADRLYARARFYLPGGTATKYEARDSTPFAEWSRDGHIKLVDRPTIDANVQARLAKYIIGLKDKYQLRAVTYDRNRATNVIALLEQAGVTCIPVPQDWHLSPALEEIERRLKAGTITISPNPVLRWNAANVEARDDHRGNLHIVKEGARGTYKGRRSSKHDGISALATALSQVLREGMTPPKPPSVYEKRGVLIF